MATKAKKAKQKAPSAPQPLSPPVDKALAELARRHLRAVIAMLVRVVALGILSAILAAQSPGLAKARLLMDAVAGGLALWPFFTALGRLYAWRIALGRAYVTEARFADAEQTLAPMMAGPRVRLFDATGEGAYWLAIAKRDLGKADEARSLLETVARDHAGSEWGARAKEAINAVEQEKESQIK
jgi:hypothetical protein